MAVCNGTVALHLALVALGFGKGDEVILPTYTMIASAFAICYTGAKPVFVDADKDSWNIDINKIEEKITERTKAIMPVHIYGKMCDMDAITKIAREHNLYIVEDAAEAHGVFYKGSKAGSFSDIAAFSFFANKNITTGEGGMVVTNNENIYKQAKYYKNVCFPTAGGRNYTHDNIGFNYRMSNLVAAIGLAQVEKADEYRALRIRNNGIYKYKGCVIVASKLKTVFVCSKCGYESAKWFGQCPGCLEWATMNEEVKAPQAVTAKRAYSDNFHGKVYKLNDIVTDTEHRYDTGLHELNRVLGGGFAGTVQAFVPVEMLDEFKAGMEAILGEGRCHVLSIRPEGGAVL